MPDNSASRFREEVVNIKLAELLAQRNIISVPETIITNLQGMRRFPDVIIATYLGIMVIIEGKIDESSSIRTILEDNCRNRIDEGVGSIVIGILYPPDIRLQRSLEELENSLEIAELKIKVYTENEESEWMNVGINNLAQILGRCYENLIKEDVVVEAVDQLREAIETVVPLLALHSATEERLKEILLVPRRE